MADMRRGQIRKTLRVMKAVNKLICLIATIGIIIATAAFGTMKVKANRMQAQTQASYKAFEKQYKEQVREYLDDIGLENAGMTLTSVTEENGIRTYRISIHHKRIDGFDNTKRDEIKADLINMAGTTYGSDMCVTDNEDSNLVYSFILPNNI